LGAGEGEGGDGGGCVVSERCVLVVVWVVGKVDEDDKSGEENEERSCCVGGEEGREREDTEGVGEECVHLHHHLSGELWWLFGCVEREERDASDVRTSAGAV